MVQIRRGIGKFSKIRSHGLEIEDTPWTKEICRDAQDTYHDIQLDLTIDLFAAAFANSNKAIKDGYDSQIKDYDHQLNGYTKETAYGKKHFFGAEERAKMGEVIFL